MRPVYASLALYFACPVFNLSYVCYSHFDLSLCYLNIHGSGLSGFCNVLLPNLSTIS